MPQSEAELSITNGSKSFSMAAKLFSSEHWTGACELYHWCRHCDDVTDTQQGHAAFQKLIQDTQDVWRGRTDSAPFKSLQNVVLKYDIPAFYPSEMLEGMQMDQNGTIYRTFEELKLYCYRVASTVGLMMCHVMGIFDIKALKNAAYLGMAMQLTNISRDVKEDHLNNRLYIPEKLLESENLTREDYFLPHNRQRLYRVVRKLIFRSEMFYRRGIAGIKYLPFRSAFVVLVAAKVYRQIGREIILRGPQALEERVFVSDIQKKIIVLQSVLIMIFLSPLWVFNRKQPVPLKETWSLS